MKILAIDIGGNHVKVLATGHRVPRKIDSGPHMTPKRMMDAVRRETASWEYDVVSIGYPGPVVDGHPAREPFHLGHGWVEFDFGHAFGRPVRMINDAAMQALGSYAGGRMLFLGLGTGLGSAMVVDEVVVPMELAHLPYRHGRTFEEYVGRDGLDRLGKRRWRHHVAVVTSMLSAALQAEDVVLGGGNVKFLHALPAGVRRGDNRNAFRGGYRLWKPRRVHDAE